MREELIAKLVCPYCLEKFRVASGAEVKNGRVTYGLLSCTCFDFPIVDGVLLLGLTKGLGGAEEHVQPYVPLQAAAIHYLTKADVAGLRRWIEKHVPLIALLWRDDITYTEFLQERNKRVMPHAIRDLQRAGRFDFLGFRGERQQRTDKGLLLRVLETRPGAAAAATFRKVKPEGIESDFFYSRFTHVDAPQMEKLLSSVVIDGPIVSLCCGHGSFETVAKWRWPDADIVSVDGQYLNLFAIQKFFNPSGDFICHNLELPFPFEDGAFTGSFSSTCLQEIPSRAHFVREQIRSTAPDGWCLLERPWWPEQRVKPLREYRFLQNHQNTEADMYRLISKLAGDRKTYATWYPKDSVSGWTPEWVPSHPGDESSDKGDMNIVVTTRDIGTKAGDSELELTKLTVNPLYDQQSENGDKVFRLRWNGKVPRVEQPEGKMVGLRNEVRVPKGEMRDDATLRHLFEIGVLVPLPRTFSTTSTGVS